MKSLTGILLFVFVFTVVKTEGRHVDNEFDELPEVEEQTENRVRDHAGTTRHRRRPRQMYGYDYQPPYSYDIRRDYNTRIQEDYLRRILSSLDEVISLMRRNVPQEPKTVYIPYPVFQFRPCVSRPNSKPTPVNNSEVPEMVTSRWPEMEDENQNWGQVFEQLPDEDGDGSRPISFVPVTPNRPLSKEPPPVEHGSSQAESTTKAPAVSRPGQCETAILNCCSEQGNQAQSNCFTRYKCSRTYATKHACDPDVIRRVLDLFSQAYAPITNV